MYIEDGYIDNHCFCFFCHNLGGHVISTYICFYMVSMTQHCTITGTMLVPVHYIVCTNVSLPKFKSLLKQFLLFNNIEIQYPK